MSYSYDVLPPKQQACYDAIVKFIDDNGYAPTRDELAAILGISDTVVYKHMIALELKGYITRTPNVRRSLKVVARSKPETLVK